MERTEEQRQRLQNTRKGIGLNLLVSTILPGIFFLLLSHFGISRLTTFIVVAAVPALWTIYGWIRERHANWIGLLSLLAVVLSYAIPFFTAGNTILTKLNDDFLIGVIGLALLFSIIIRRPLLIPLLELLAPNVKEFKLVEKIHGNRGGNRKVTFLTAALGTALVVKVTIDIMLAFTIQIETYLAIKKIVNWGIIALLVIIWLDLRKVIRE